MIFLFLTAVVVLCRFATALSVDVNLTVAGLQIEGSVDIGLGLPDFLSTSGKADPESSRTDFVNTNTKAEADKYIDRYPPDLAGIFSISKGGLGLNNDDTDENEHDPESGWPAAPEPLQPSPDSQRYITFPQTVKEVIGTDTSLGEHSPEAEDLDAGANPDLASREAPLHPVDDSSVWMLRKPSEHHEPTKRFNQAKSEDYDKYRDFTGPRKRHKDLGTPPSSAHVKRFMPPLPVPDDARTPSDMNSNASSSVSTRATSATPAAVALAPRSFDAPLSIPKHANLEHVSNSHPAPPCKETGVADPNQPAETEGLSGEDTDNLEPMKTGADDQEDMETRSGLGVIADVLDIKRKPTKAIQGGGTSAAHRPANGEGPGFEITPNLGIAQAEVELQEDIEVEATVAGIPIANVDVEFRDADEDDDDYDYNGGMSGTEHKRDVSHHRYSVDVDPDLVTEHAATSKHSAQLSMSSGCNPGEIRCTPQGTCLPNSVKCCKNGKTYCSQSFYCINNGQSCCRVGKWCPLSMWGAVKRDTSGRTDSVEARTSREDEWAFSIAMDFRL